MTHQFQEFALARQILSHLQNIEHDQFKEFNGCKKFHTNIPKGMNAHELCHVIIQQCCANWGITYSLEKI